MNDQYGDPRNFDPNVYGYDPYEDPNVWGWDTPPSTTMPVEPQPTLSPTAPTTPTTTGGGGKTPAQIEAEGREYDRQHGLIGGYMMDGVWVNGSPSTTGGGRSDPLPGGDFGQMQLPNQGFSWPTYNAPRFAYGDFPGFKPFKQPTMDEILADPVLQAQLTEGQRRIKGDRAFRGILNTGDTLKDIFDWSSDRVKLGANDAFDRAFKVYDINERQNPFNTWNANRGLALDTFNANAPQARDEFFYNSYEPARQQFQQNYDVWKSQGDWLTNLSRPIE